MMPLRLGADTMPWWSWILLGALLLGSEMLVDSGFYLLFLEFAGLLVGAAGLAGIQGEITAITERFRATLPANKAACETPIRGVTEEIGVHTQ